MQGSINMGFLGIFSNLKEVSHSCITLEIAYPEALPENIYSWL